MTFYLLAILKSRDETLREQWIKVYEARLVREEVAKCHRAEGVNHYHACHDLVQHYLELLKDARVSCCRASQWQAFT
jgi:hypothetical protein